MNRQAAKRLRAADSPAILEGVLLVIRLVSTKMLRRYVAAAIGIFIIGLAASPGTAPARGDGTTSIAVNTFENEAGAPAKVVSDLTNAAYRGVSASGRFTAKGSGPLPYHAGLTSDPFIEALHSAAATGADDVLLGSIIQVGGGQVVYRLSLYRIAPTTFVGSQVFAQPYPASDANALSAGLANNVATLDAPRQALGTIFSTTNGAVGDVGSMEGFKLGDRFNVMRNGQKMAEATISSIQDDQATLTISNAAPGYSPMVGDALVGLRPLAPVPAAPGEHTSFNPLGFIAAVGGVLLAIGHHGQPGTFSGFGGTPAPSASPFIITGFATNGHPPTGTIEFDFNALVSSSSQTGIQGDTTFASFVMQPPNSNATTAPAPLSQLGTVTFTTDPTGTMSILTVGEQNGLVGGKFQISFTSAVTSTTGAALLASQTLLTPFALINHSSTVMHRAPTGRGPKPVFNPKPIPRPIGSPKPNPPNVPVTPH